MEKNKQPMRIAHIMGKWLGGGVEAVVMNYYRNIDRSKIQFDFICDYDSTDIPYEEIKKLGGKIILIPPYQKVFKYHKELKKVLNDGKYKIVHSHINTLSVFSLFAAKMAGVPVRIAHSHSTTNKKEKKKNLMKQVLRPFSKLFATHYMACTEHAGRWMFGDKEFEKGKVYILNNAIELDKYKYNEQIRNSKRKELNISDDTFVVGHVGRFVEQKNHRFLIEVFNELQKEKSNSILLLAGQGPLQEEMKEKVKELNIEDKVKFLGQRNDINELYQAFDMFLLPSLYEGLGMVLIEAQCSGLPCVASSEVPAVAKLTNLVEFVGLNDGILKWKKTCNSINNTRTSRIKEINEMKYNINNEASLLAKYYLDKIPQKIELFGIPAVGKSYYAHNYLKEYKDYHDLIDSKNRLLRIWKKILYSVLFLIKHPIFSTNVLKSLSELHFSTKSKKNKMFLYVCAVLFLSEKSNKVNEPVVLEEGIIQCIFGICYVINYDISFIETCIEKFSDYLLEKIILLKTDNETVRERLIARNKSGGSELEHDIKENAKALMKAEKIIDDISICLKKCNIEFEEIKI